MSWRSGQAYSPHLRERVLSAVDAGMGAYAAAAAFQVSVSYIYKALIRRRETGETGTRSQRCQIRPKLAPHAAAIDQRVADCPDTTIAELRAWLLAERGVSASYGAVWTTLDRLGLTHKKSKSGRRSRTARTLPRRARPGVPSSPS